MNGEREARVDVVPPAEVIHAGDQEMQIVDSTALDSPVNAGSHEASLVDEPLHQRLSYAGSKHWSPRPFLLGELLELVEHQAFCAATPELALAQNLAPFLLSFGLQVQRSCNPAGVLFFDAGIELSEERSQSGGRSMRTK